MYWSSKLIAVIYLSLFLAVNSNANESSANSPFDELLNYQERALMNAFLDKKIVINGFKSPNIFTGYIPFKENQKFNIEAKLASRMIVCVERVPGVERQVCANEAVLKVAQGDKTSAKRYLVYTVSYFKHDSKDKPETLYFSYRYAKDEEDLFASWDLDVAALEKDVKKIKPIFMKFVKDAVTLANSLQNQHPVLPGTVPRIELLDLTNDRGTYEAKVSAAGEPPIRALVKVAGVHDDRKTITFIDKDKTPSLYGHTIEYNKLFWGRTFDGGKQVFEVCTWSQEQSSKTCNQYLIKLSDYFDDSVDWAGITWGR